MLFLASPTAFTGVQTLCVFEFVQFQLPTIHWKQVLSNITNM